MSARPTTLVTGFGPFGEVRSNPTMRLVSRLPPRFATLHLPTSFARAPAMLRTALLEGGYERVVMLGVAASADRLRVERFARNWDEGSAADVDGFQPGPRAIVPDAPARLPVTTSPEAWLEALTAAGLPATVSDDAGGFLCNHALFHALCLASQLDAPPRVGFLHVPADEHTLAPLPASARPMRFEDLLRAVEAVLATESRE